MIATRRLFQTALVASAAALAASHALAQTFPDKPIRIVVGAPAGGTADLMGRVLAEGLSAQFGQPVVVDNKPGAAGLLGLQELLKSPRDGHTLMVAVNGLVSELPHVMKMPFEPIKELRPLVDLGRSGLLMVGSPQLSATNVKEAIAHIKANPGKISYASYSTGSMSHTIGLKFNKLAGTDMQHVGYKGSPPALADVVGGHVAFMFDGPATSIPMISGGKVKVFATTAPARMKALPDVPTFAELGYQDLTEVIWMGLWITPDVPNANQAKLLEAVTKVMQLPATRERFSSLGLQPGSNATPEELSRGLRVAFDRQGEQLKAIGFKPE